MNQPILKLPFKGRLICSQSNLSKKNRSHNKNNPNTKYALDFTLDNKTLFKILASGDGIAKIWKCCKHNSGRCNCGLGFGNQIRIYHNSFFTFYSHLSKIKVKDNKKVKQGQIIGIAGKTGLAGDVHLHWNLGKEPKESEILEKKFIPFWSIKAEKIEIKNNNKKILVKSTDFKENKGYLSTNRSKSTKPTIQQ